MKYRTVFFSLLILALNFSFSYSNDLENSIIGKWITPPSNSGLGATWLFDEKGKLTVTYGAVVEAKYTIDGNIIITKFLSDESVKENEDQPDLHTPFKINEDTLIQFPEDEEKRTKMKRRGIVIQDAHPVVGIWEFEHYTGGMAIMEYTESGLSLLTVPFPGDKLEATYNLDDSVLTIQEKDKESKSRNIVFSNNELIIKATEDKKEEKLYKFNP